MQTTEWKKTGLGSELRRIPKWGRRGNGASRTRRVYPERVRGTSLITCKSQLSSCCRYGRIGRVPARHTTRPRRNKIPYVAWRRRGGFNDKIKYRVCALDDPAERRNVSRQSIARMRYAPARRGFTRCKIYHRVWYIITLNRVSVERIHSRDACERVDFYYY